MQPYVVALIAMGGFAVYLAIVMVCLYEKGCLVRIHPMNKYKEGQIKVACVGDSIPYGSYHLTKRNYPAVLSKMLGAEVIAKPIRTAVKEMCSAYGYHFLDMYSAFDNRPELFQDGVHPNVAGSKLFAETIYHAIKKD